MKRQSNKFQCEQVPSLCVQSKIQIKQWTNPNLTAKQIWLWDEVKTWGGGGAALSTFYVLINWFRFTSWLQWLAAFICFSANVKYEICPMWYHLADLSSMHIFDHIIQFNIWFHMFLCSRNLYWDDDKLKLPKSSSALHKF